MLVSSIRAHEVSLTMRQSWILLPGARSLIPPDLIVYRVFIGPVNGIPTGKSIDQIQCTADDGFNAYSGMKILKLTVPFNQVGGNSVKILQPNHYHIECFVKKIVRCIPAIEYLFIGG